MAFGNRLRELRKTAGLTQAQLARRAGVTLATLREYEQARRRADPSLRMAARLAVALGVGVGDLAAALEGAEAPAPVEPSAPPGGPSAASPPTALAGDVPRR
jgi:transcriptional regulator with XRE-family HTH domain